MLSILLTGFCTHLPPGIYKALVLHPVRACTKDLIGYLATLPARYLVVDQLKSMIYSIVIRAYKHFFVSVIEASVKQDFAFKAFVMWQARSLLNY